MDKNHRPRQGQYMTKRKKNNCRPSKPRYFFREWRKFRGYTQEELGAMIGVSVPAISQLETGKQGFTDSTLAALSDALGCENPGDLLMHNPLDEDAPWSLWNQVKRQDAESRQKIVAVVKAMLEEDAA